jgi:Aerotolerance regulator N-terminal/von Willebrand factor type A domain/CARDB
MNFLAPGMLFGAAAVAIPIAIHFFFRARHRIVPWAAMKFLLESIEQTSRRLRFQELLLLLVRCLVLATLAFAMARPMTSAIRGAGRGDAVDAVFVMDTSYSMGAEDGAMTRFVRAQAAALDALEKLPPHSTVQVISSSDRAILLGPRSPSNLDQARTFFDPKLKNLELTALATDFAPGILEAKEILQRGQLPNKELYVFSDFQKSGFEQQPTLLVDTLKELKDKANITLVRCGSRMPKNAALLGITAQAGVPRPGQRTGFAVLVKNTGTEPMTDVRLTLMADGDEKNVDTQTISTLDAGETRAVTMSAKFDKAGPRVLTAKIAYDELDGDNRFDQVIPVREQVNIIVVNGGMNEREATASSTFFLNNAIAPGLDKERGAYFLQLREVEPRLATPALLAKADLVFLVNTAMPGEQGKLAEAAARRNVVPADFLSELAGWVRQGHALVIFPGSNTDPDAYNRELGKKLGLLPMPIKQMTKIDPKAALHLSRMSFTYPGMRDFKEDKRYDGIDSVTVWRYLQLDDAKPETKDAAKETKAAKDEKKADAPAPAPTGEVRARLQNGLPFLTSRRIDGGDVVLFASAFEPTWNDLPVVRQVSVPLIQSLISQLLQSQTQNHNLVAGSGLTWYPKEKEPQNFSLRTPSGGIVRLGLPLVKDNRPFLAIGALDQAGVYRLMASTATSDAILADAGVAIAVTPDLRESADLTNLSDEQIDTRLGFRPTHATAGVDGAPTTGLDRYRREWTLYLLAAVLALAAFESVLAFLCGKSW